MAQQRDLYFIPSEAGHCFRRSRIARSIGGNDAVDTWGQSDFLERIGNGTMGAGERTAKFWSTVT
jgi:hypothetical protein